VLEIVAFNDRKTPISEGEEIKVLWHTCFEKSSWRQFNGCICFSNSKNLEIVG